MNSLRHGLSMCREHNPHLPTREDDPLSNFIFFPFQRLECRHDRWNISSCLGVWGRTYTAGDRPSGETGTGNGTCPAGLLTRVLTPTRYFPFRRSQPVPLAVRSPQQGSFLPGLLYFLIVTAEESSGTTHQQKHLWFWTHPSMSSWLREVSIPTSGLACVTFPGMPLRTPHSARPTSLPN